MNITNFTWIDTFAPPTPPIPPTSSTPPTPLPSESPKTIILASVIGVLGGVIILFCGFFVYRWIKKRRQENNRPGFPGMTVDDLPGFPGTADSDRRNFKK